MATVKVTVTLGEAELARIKELVRHGRTANVSAFVQHAVTTALQDQAGWEETLDALLERTGGPATPDELAWAEQVVSGGPADRKPRQKHPAA